MLLSALRSLTALLRDSQLSWLLSSWEPREFLFEPGGRKEEKKDDFIEKKKKPTEERCNGDTLDIGHNSVL